MQGASSMKNACNKFVAQITAGYALGDWRDAATPTWDKSGSKLRELWLHVPDRLGTKEVEVSKQKPQETASAPMSKPDAETAAAIGDSFDDEF
eukprot:COSAG01_NODE_8713_length_2688_cov_3.451139_2_plen_93_part_00